MADLPKGVAYYTAQELAEHLRVSVTTIHRAIRDGDLVALRLRGAERSTVRVPAADAHQWILDSLTTDDQPQA